MQSSLAKQHIPIYSIAIVSATALSYEILLTRLFAIIQYHHFAYMIISLALLGYGISGTLLFLFQKLLLRNYQSVFVINIVLFAVSSIACYLAAQHIVFNAEEILWDFSQSLRLLANYLLFMLPFLFAANAIGLSLMKFGEHIGKLYGADLLGAGIGSICIIGLLFVLLPNHALPVLFAAGIVAAIVACWELKCCQAKTMGIFIILVSAASTIPDSWLALSISPYKGLPQLLRVQDTKLVATKSSPLGLLQVVESPTIPLRYAPGLSLNSETEPPPQLAVFVDGGGMSAINQETGQSKQLNFLDQQTSAAVYHLSSTSRVLILGAGTGNDVLQARHHNVPSIDAVELNPQVIELMTKDYANYSGNIYNQGGITVHIQDARGYVTNTQQQYDVIQIALLDSHSASASGLYALSESYLYTVEAIQEYLARLSADGYLSITRWLKLPPRDSLKLFSTVVKALRDKGSENPGQHMMLIRGWQTSTLLVKNSAVNSQDIEQLIKFCQQRSFDIAYFPGIEPTQTNQFNLLREPIFYQATHALLDDNSQQFMEQYKFNLKPATDNQPYFFNFFKWSLLPEIVALKGKGGMPLLEWGYIILVATFLQAVLASMVLILMPLFAGKDKAIKLNASSLTSLFYFIALGLGFLFIEIAFIQKFTLFLQHPLYAIAITLAAFLLFSGWGSHFSRRLQQQWGYRKTLKVAVATIIVTGASYSLLLDLLFSVAMAWPVFLKISLTGILIAPLAFSMGMPFPLALSFLNNHYPNMVPWVWGVNGCASVISAVLAMLLAIQFGFNIVIFIALLLYASALLFFTRLVNTTIAA